MNQLSGNAKPISVGNGSAISILVGNGNGTFLQAATVRLADGFTPDSILAADLNSAGKQHLVVISSLSRHDPNGDTASNTDHVSLFLNNGNGTFQAEQILATASWLKSSFAHHRRLSRRIDPWGI
jgi:hypothetical protein